jgi:serine/threonine-protein kinase RsbT
MASGLASSGHRPSSTRVFPPIAFHRTVYRVLLDYLPARDTQAILAAVGGATRIRAERLTPAHVPSIVDAAEKALDRIQVDPARRTACLRRLQRLGGPSAPEPTATRESNEILLVRVEQEDDIVRARLAAGDACRQLGFSEMKCTRVMTAISELARNIFHYAGDGQIVITRVDGDHPGVEITARDQGPGIENVGEILRDNYRSPRGTGGGLKAVRLLMDSIQIESSPGGTMVVVRKRRA